MLEGIIGGETMFGPTISDLTELWNTNNYVYSSTTPKTVTDKPFETVTDDPLAPAPSPMAGSWQCPACLTIYAWWVSKCECQKRNQTFATNTTNDHVIKGGI